MHADMLGLRVRCRLYCMCYSAYVLLCAAQHLEIKQILMTAQYELSCSRLTDLPAAHT